MPPKKLKCILFMQFFCTFYGYTMYHSFIKPVYLETALIQLHFDMSGRELILMCGFGSQMLSSERVVECLKSFLFILHSLPLALLLAVPAFSLG